MLGQWIVFGRHGLMGKQNTYEESVRVPLIFAGADIPRGKQEQGYVYLLDIFPTLCEMMGWKIPDSVEGESFLKPLQKLFGMDGKACILPTTI